MQTIKQLKDVWDKFQFILTSPQKKLGVILILLTIVGAAFETLGVSIVLPLVQIMVTPEELWKNNYIISLAEFFNIKNNTQLIFFMGFAVILVYLLKNLFLLFLSWIRIKFACKIQRELSTEMLTSYMGRGYTYFLKTNIGDLMRGMTTSIQNTYLALYQIFKLFAEILTVICICVFIMFTDFEMALCIIILSLICLLLVVLGFKKWVKRCGEKNYKYAGVLNNVILQAFNGIKEILVMNRKRYFTETYYEQYKKQQSALVGQTVASECPAYIIEGVCITGFILAVCFKSTSESNIGLIVPQLAAFAVAAFRILPSLGRISSDFNQFIYCMPNLNEAYLNFKEARSIKSRQLINLDNEKAIKLNFVNELNLTNIKWLYDNSTKLILDNVNITIRKGQSVALIGQSGAGKTTLSDLILGLLEPQEGTIEVDGTNILDARDEWSNMISFVPQTVYLSNDTIRKNVAFGIKEKDINDELVWSALRQAQLLEFIKELPEGIETMLGERGIRFSGGQRQRIAIARALYNNPEILVLDEATSALDTETETAVMESIEMLQGKKTLIIIAHRLTTIRNCDVIYEIADGKAIECHKEEILKRI